MNRFCDKPGLIPIDTAIRTMCEHSPQQREHESVPLLNAYNRVLGTAIKSTCNVPPADNSAMDGYAMFVADSIEAGTEFRCIGHVHAGDIFEHPIATGECVRIMTGAALPAGVNTVIMQENCELSQDNKITINQPLNSGNSVRLAGEDIQIGQTIIESGTRLGAAHIALIASVGLATCDVNKRLRVAIIATGDELVEPGIPLQKGQIYESNRYALDALLRQFPVEVEHIGIIKDNAKSIESALHKAAEQADLILSCGGVSVGDADLVKDALEKLGQIDFWQVAIKPGKPFAFGKLNRSVFCGLPGNPVSSYVTFDILVRPLLWHMLGAVEQQRNYVVATTTAQIRKQPGRANYLRGVAVQDPDGHYQVSTNGKQGSGIMTSIANANCYILLDIDQGSLPIGSQVKIQLF